MFRVQLLSLVFLASIIVTVLSVPVNNNRDINKLNDGLHAVQYTLQQLSPSVSKVDISIADMIHEVQMSTPDNKTQLPIHTLLMETSCQRVSQ